MDILTIISNKSPRIPPDLSTFSIPSLRSPFKSNHFINVNITILHMEINILRIVWKTIILVSFHSLWMKIYIYLSTYCWDSSSYFIRFSPTSLYKSRWKILLMICCASSSSTLLSELRNLFWLRTSSVTHRYALISSFDSKRIFWLANVKVIWFKQ